MLLESKEEVAQVVSIKFVEFRQNFRRLSVRQPCLELRFLFQPSILLKHQLSLVERCRSPFNYRQFWNKPPIVFIFYFQLEHHQHLFVLIWVIFVRWIRNSIKVTSFINSQLLTVNETSNSFNSKAGVAVRFNGNAVKLYWISISTNRD